MIVKSTCGAVSLLAAVFGRDVDQLKALYGLPTKRPLCPVCGNPIPIYNEIYCSIDCRKKDSWIELSCDICGILFKRRKSEIICRTNHPWALTGKTQQHWFCSRRCKSIFAGKTYGFGKANREKCTS